MGDYYSNSELLELGLKKIGKNVLIHKDARLYGRETISIGSNVRIDAFSILSGKITLGNFVHIGNYSALYGTHGIEMKDFTALSSRVTLYTSNEDYSNGTSLTNPTIPNEYRNIETGNILLDKHVMVGANSILLPSVHLEEGVIIGAHSLVKENCKQWTIFVGNPLREIKPRPRKTILDYEKKLQQKYSEYW